MKMDEGDGCFEWYTNDLTWGDVGSRFTYKKFALDCSINGGDNERN